MSRAFTAKQRGFIEWYCSASVNMNGTEAARRAGYKGNDGTLANTAAENLRKPYIRQEIDIRLDAALSGANITVEKVLRDLEITYVKALTDGHYTAAVRCLELQGKYLKMFTDKIEHVEQPIDEMSTEELVQMLFEISKSGGLDLGKLLAESEALDAN